MRSHLRGDWRQGSPGPLFRVTGSTGSFVVPAGMDGQEDALIAGGRPGVDRLGSRAGSRLGLGTARQGAVGRTSERGRWDRWYAEIAAAAAAAAAAAGTVPGARSC